MKKPNEQIFFGKDLPSVLINIDKATSNKDTVTTETPRCLNCGKPMIPYIDPATNKVDPYSWTCECMGDMIVGIG
jgi:hypothetical protein